MDVLRFLPTASNGTFRQLWYEAGWRRYEDTRVIVENTFVTQTKFSLCFHKVLCHNSVESFQGLNVIRIDFRELLIGSIGIFYSMTAATFKK